MHELGLCEDIVDAVARRAGDRLVSRVRVRVGVLHHVHPEAFEQSFAAAAMGTVADGACAELVFVPVTARCGGCGVVVEAHEPVLGCATCGAVDVDQSGGDELMLESLEYRA